MLLVLRARRARVRRGAGRAPVGVVRRSLAVLPASPDAPDARMSARSRPSVLLAGGGIGRAHLAAARPRRRLRRRDPDVRITALGTATGLETRLVPERGLPAAR